VLLGNNVINTLCPRPSPASLIARQQSQHSHQHDFAHPMLHPPVPSWISAWGPLPPPKPFRPLPAVLISLSRTETQCRQPSAAPSHLFVLSSVPPSLRDGSASIADAAHIVISHRMGIRCRHPHHIGGSLSSSSSSSLRIGGSGATTMLPVLSPCVSSRASLFLLRESAALSRATGL
jgi:hypothetical protein